MLFLERAGIQTDIRETHQFTSEERRIKPNEFFERAAVMLDQLSTPVLENINSILENYSGRWNPMGFMVLPLGTHQELGILRLHVWPKDLRKLTPKGEPIHNHAWHLASRILTGIYSDDIYVVREPEYYPEDENQRIEQGLMRVFSIGFGDTGGTLETDGSCVRAVLSEHRTAKAGEGHDLALALRDRGILLRLAPELLGAHINRDTLSGLIAQKRAHGRGRGYMLVHEGPGENGWSGYIKNYLGRHLIQPAQDWKKGEIDTAELMYVWGTYAVLWSGVIEEMIRTKIKPTE